MNPEIYMWRVNEWSACLKKRYYTYTAHPKLYPIGGPGPVWSDSIVVGIMPVYSREEMYLHGF